MDKNKPALTKRQILDGYYAEPYSFIHVASRVKSPYDVELVSDYQGQDKLWFYLETYNFSQKEKKHKINEWVEFFQTNTKTIKLLYFRSGVPQVLFDAACCQENLEELHFKYGSYKDLSALKKLADSKLKHLYIGSGSRVEDISPLTEMKNLVSLYVENFKRIEDYSILTKLQSLQQLVISGPNMGLTPIKDLDFLRDMPNLLSFFNPSTTIKKKYTKEEKEKLLAELTHLTFIGDYINW